VTRKEDLSGSFPPAEFEQGFLSDLFGPCTVFCAESQRLPGARSRDLMIGSWLKQMETG
jgi:hypothetical protein